MKKFTILFLLLMLIGIVTADVYTIGTGTSTQTYIPFLGSYDYGWSKVIYTATELSSAGLSAGQIDGIGFEVGNTPSNYTRNDQRVYIRHTVETSCDNTYPDNTGFTEVYNASYTWNGGGWHHIMFSTPFVWDGTSNIVILWENQCGTYAFSAPNFRYTSTSPDYLAAYKYQDSSFPAVSGTTMYNRPNIQIVTPDVDPPNPAVLVAPADGSQFTSAVATLSWTPGDGPLVTGYDLYYGTTNPPTTHVDVGFVTSYTLAGLPFETLHYWQIVPRNAMGSATGCPVWSFTTMDDPTITNFPYTEGFEEVWIGTPAAPLGWSQITVSGTSPWLRSTTSPHTGSYCAQGPWASAGGEHLLITPPLNFGTGDYRLKFWLKGSSSVATDLKVQIASSNSSAANFSTDPDLAYYVAGTNMPTSWTEQTISLAAYEGIQYIAFRLIDDNGYALYIDDVRVEEIPTSPIFALSPDVTEWDYDLQLINSTTGKEFTITNLGGGNLELNSIAVTGDFYALSEPFAGASLAAGESAPFTVNYTPTAAGVHNGNIAIGDNRATTNISLLGEAFDPTITSFSHTENFDGTWSGSPAAPLGWTVINANNDSYMWSQANNYITPTHSTPYAAHGMGNTDDYLITPPIDLTDIDVRMMWWDIVENSTKANSYKVLLSITNNEITSFTVELADITCTNTAWTQHVLPLSDYNGQTVYIAFYQYASAATYYGFGIDDFLLEEIPSDPIFALSPDVTEWDYDLQLINSTTGKEFTITNVGGGTLELSSIAVTGDYFALSEPFAGASLAAGESVPFTVNYTPTATGLHNGNIAIGDTRATTNISLLGEAFDPTISDFPWTEDFGTTTSFPPPNWTRLAGLYLTDTPSTTTTGWTYDDFCNVVTTPKNTSAKVNVYGTGCKYWLVTPPIAIPADGYELKFDLGLTDYASINPIEYPEGQADDKFIVIISDSPNMGSPTTLREWNNSGSEYVFNEISHTGEMVIINLDGYRGTKYIAFYGESTVSITGEDNDLFVDNVTVRETPTEPIFVIDPIGKDFGKQEVGSSAEVVFTISNTGGADLEIAEGGISLSGTNPDQFGLGDIPYPLTITPGTNATITVSFEPTSEGLKSATLEIVDNTPSEKSIGKSAKATQIVDLSGEGVIFNTVPYAYGFSEGWGDWTVVNGTQTNKWHVGDPGIFGTNAAYISDDNGISWNYNTGSTSVVHFYQDINFPAETTDFKLKFDWLCNGEGVYTAWDYLRVYAVDTTVMPQAGTLLTSELGTYNLSGTLITDIQTESLDLPDAFAGTTKRIVFTWRNDYSTGTQPPAVVDNIRFVIGSDADTGEIDGGLVHIEPTVTPDGGSPINPNILIQGLVGSGTVSVVAGYADAGLPNAGLSLTLSGVSFSGSTITIVHDLGFAPTQIALKIVPGDWLLLNSGSPEVITWDATTISFTMATKADGDFIIVFPIAEGDTLPVTLSTFTAVLTADLHVNIAWTAESETNHAGYNILRSEVQELSTAIMINSALIDEGIENGTQISYEYTDTEVYHQARYYYWLEDRSLTGESTYHGPLVVTIYAEGEEPEIPTIPVETKLFSAFPNPFNPSTNLRYSMKDAGDVRIEVYNVKGQLMRAFENTHNQAGYYQVNWDGRDANGRLAGTGVYFYRMISGKYTSTKKMILAK